MYTVSIMFASLCILGRQSALSLAELESLLGATKVKPVNDHAALIDSAPADIPFYRLGGTIKLCKVLSELSTTDWNQITKYLVENVPKHVQGLPDGKVKFGVSVYGLGVKPNAINAAALEIKKATRAAGRSMRVIPNNSTELNSAQVLNNKLTAELGMELILVRHGSATILAQTAKIQDIDAYAARDQERPARDARVGMLPPKLAQTIINLANPSVNQAVLDPFCGTGVILQEALLMGFDTYGTDIEERMIDYSNRNLEWLGAQSGVDLSNQTYLLETGDACIFEWQDFDTIACETYLGRPFSTEPNPEKLREIIRDVDTIHKKFLQNVARQTKPGFRMCIAVPAWYTKNGIKYLPILDHLTDMGYTRMSFVHAANKDLIYHREGQIVGRELIVLIRK